MLLISASSLITALSVSLIVSSSPLSLGLWVLLTALAISSLTGIMFNSWFAIIIFLVYIGGMLVMFAYFTALTPNKPLGMKTTTTTFLIIWMIMITLFLMPNSNLTSLFSLPSPLYSPPITVLFSPSNTLLLLAMAIILFLILVTVVKIVNITMGPLRPFSYV